jgi:hypothetical protein
MPNSRPKTKVSLSAVILRIRTIANNHYQGKIYDNILPIFNQLTTVEKRVLLRGLVGICFIVEDKILAETETVRDIRQQVETTVKKGLQTKQDTEEVLEVENQKQMISMKAWMFKLVSFGIIGFLLLAMLFSWLATGKVDFLDKLKWLEEAFKLVVGFAG